MLIRRATDIPSSEITDERIYLRRREFLRTLGLATAGLAAGMPALEAQTGGPRPPALENVRKGPFGTSEPMTPFEDITTYNNFYEFGTDKSSPSRTAGGFRTKPWTVKVDGACNHPADYQLEDLLKPSALEERVYRMRCVEGWSMVIPWVGVPLADLIRRSDPTSQAKFVEFTTLYDSRQMPGQHSSVLEWPYVEGLRLDEAMHPLTILAVGLYGAALPNQDGAPLRLVVPWKYGFKGIKSIVRIQFVDRQPETSWQRQNSSEYGFYSNVNPTVDHPRWSQATERRIGEFLKRKTLMFNGYGDQVASLYAGMDLRKVLLVGARAVRLFVKPAVFALALVPVARLAWLAAVQQLGANPLEAVTHGTGDWALRFLLLTLAVTPLRAVTGWNAVVRVRRMLGLFAFFYASLHLLTYLWFDQFFSWPDILRDIPKRPFITVGFFAFVILVPLAATSTAGMIRRMGGRRWQALHRLVYLAAAAAVVHFWWLVKADISQPRLYGLILLGLLAARAGVAVRRAATRAKPSKVASAGPGLFV